MGMRTVLQTDVATVASANKKAKLGGAQAWLASACVSGCDQQPLAPVEVSVKGETKFLVIFELVADVKSNTICARSEALGAKALDVFRLRALVKNPFKIFLSLMGKVLQVLKKVELPAPTAALAVLIAR